jgi:predicted dehydrogenase
VAKKRLGVGMIGGGFVAQFHIRSWIAVRDADINGVVAKTMKPMKQPP